MCESVTNVALSGSDGVWSKSGTDVVYEVSVTEVMSLWSGDVSVLSSGANGSKAAAECVVVSVDLLVVC